mgnify:CR=1 FL=1
MDKELKSMQDTIFEALKEKDGGGRHRFGEVDGPIAFDSGAVEFLPGIMPVETVEAAQ